MSNQIKVIDKVEFIPASDYILVRPDNETTQTKGGIIIPQGVLTNKKTHSGTVVAVGPGRPDPNGPVGKRLPMDCSSGDRIVFAVFSGYPLNVGQEEFFMMKNADIIAFINEEFHFETESQIIMPEAASLIS